MTKLCRVVNLSNSRKIDYGLGWTYQKALVEECLEAQKTGGDSRDALLFLQHFATFTLGRGADCSNVKFEVGSSNSPSLLKVERGGDIAWHGPGQLVVYPIFDLHRHRKDLHWFVRSLEQSVIDVLSKEYSIDGERDAINSGVFVNKKKISALGITASRWITMHGIAINLTCNMDDFSKIVPCGIQDERYGVCRLQDLTTMHVDIATFSEQLMLSLSRSFDLRLERHTEAEDEGFLQSLLAKHPELSSERPRPLTKSASHPC